MQAIGAKLVDVSTSLTKLYFQFFQLIVLRSCILIKTADFLFEARGGKGWKELNHMKLNDRFCHVGCLVLGLRCVLQGGRRERGREGLVAFCQNEISCCLIAIAAISVSFFFFFLFRLCLNCCILFEC